MNESFSVAPGGVVESYQPHSGRGYIYGVWVDNFSGGWLSIEGQNLWVPPYTRGWKAGINPGITSITIRSYDFAHGQLIAGATGQAANVTIWDENKGDSEGAEFFDQQTVPLQAVISIDNTGPVTIVAAPTVGRIRIYELRITYADNAWDNYTANVQFNNLVTELVISPANPHDAQVFAAPQGDLNIGDSLIVSMAALTTNVTNMIVDVSVRYAIR